MQAFFFSRSHNYDFFRYKPTNDYRFLLDSSFLKLQVVLSKFCLTGKKKKRTGGDYGGKSIKFLTLPISNLILFIFLQFLPYSNSAIYLPYSPKEFDKRSPFLYIHTTLRRGVEGQNSFAAITDMVYNTPLVI